MLFRSRIEVNGETRIATGANGQPARAALSRRSEGPPFKSNRPHPPMHATPTQAKTPAAMALVQTTP